MRQSEDAVMTDLMLIFDYWAKSSLIKLLIDMTLNKPCL